jgi:hypothetical protein
MPRATCTAPVSAQVEIIQQIMPAACHHADRGRRQVRWQAHQEVLLAARADAHDRIPLFRLASTWRSRPSARAVLYERFFFGDPVRKGALVAGHNTRFSTSEMVARAARRGRRGLCRRSRS